MMDQMGIRNTLSAKQQKSITNYERSETKLLFKASTDAKTCPAGEASMKQSNNNFYSVEKHIEQAYNDSLRSSLVQARTTECYNLVLCSRSHHFQVHTAKEYNKMSQEVGLQSV